jgi:hypothetical protein
MPRAAGRRCKAGGRGSSIRDTLLPMRVLLLAAALASLVAFAYPASACAPAPPPGGAVHITEESAIIVWDERGKREHFIRRASFRATSKDFGFLVPTPEEPDLAEVADELFDRLDRATWPEFVDEDSFDGVEPTSLFLGPTSCVREVPRVETAMAAAPVRVLSEHRVAGYDALVLEAEDPRALADWLKAHGYAVRPELTAWLAPYVARRWKITAFRIASSEGAPSVSTAAVRMSFSTERPFYPYREPTDQRENRPPDAPSTRRLQVFFIGPTRVDGSIGAASAPWPGKAIWSDKLDAVKHLGTLPVATPFGAWLTRFEDDASPRPGTDDLFFAPAADDHPVKPPPIVNTRPVNVLLPIEPIVLGVILAWKLVRRSRRKKAVAKVP